jgi:hypothetical protein
MARGTDETQLQNVVILKSDNERMKRACAELERPTVVYMARLLIHYGVEHLGDVMEWYKERAVAAGAMRPSDQATGTDGTSG